ncbi:hypothetical protein CN966_31805 [Bacillus cereus]|nr:hypothetical protein IC7_05378 [Bacillus cereus BAG1O-1]PGN45618.1 hypothetical protein CN966_31805 [Bacillus cereus]
MKKLCTILFSIFLLLILSSCGRDILTKDTIEDGFTHRVDFENKLKEYSNGMIEIEDSNIEYRDKENDRIYKVDWKEFEIYSKIGKSDWLSNSYTITTEKLVFEDKTANEQYRKLMEIIIRIADPKLTIEEVNKLIDSGVDLNEVKDGRGFYYQLKVGQDPVNNIDFTIVPKGGW